MVGRAHRFVTGCGFTAAAIDAPGHGGARFESAVRLFARHLGGAVTSAA